MSCPPLTMYGQTENGFIQVKLDNPLAICFWIDTLLASFRHVKRTK
jgi:hypothetical protein